LKVIGHHFLHSIGKQEIMSTIRLQDVTKIYPRAEPLGSWASSSKTDRAFADRVLTRAVIETDLSRQKGPVMALDHTDLTIPDGQTFALIGPSGCGKSTLLRVVAGLETDFTGRVLYDDQDMRDVPPKDRYIGMVFQNYALYPHFKSKGNLRFFFRMRKASDEEAEERIRVTSEMMGIGFSELLQHKPGMLSGGQQQRVAIARALVRKPHLFLFDEPLSNLDAKLRTHSRFEIKRLLNRFKITAIYVTHDQVEAIALGDRIAVMRSGMIEQEGAYQTLRQSPTNAFVAGFLDSPAMNLLTGGIVADGILHLGEISVPLPHAVKSKVCAGQELTLGVRPEAALLALGDQSRPDGICLRGTVEVVEPDFAHRTELIYLRTGALSYAVRVALDISLHVGDEVTVVFPADKLYFFDGESERRIHQPLS